MHSLRSRRFVLIAFAFASPVIAVAAPSGCDDLSSIPITEGVDYDTQIRPLVAGDLSVYSCANCHSPTNPAGGLDLKETSMSPPSIEAIAQRVVERKPRESLFFNKINCDDPGDFGARMPFGGTLTLADQALIYDWIAQGARGLNDLNEISDTVFRSGLESTRID